MLYKHLLGDALLLVGFTALAGSVACSAQQSKPQPLPYASIGAATYDGPNRGSSYDLKGPMIRIGLLAPLHGPEEPAGQAMVAAAKLALQDASRVSWPDGRELTLDTVDTSVPPWGALGDEIIRMVIQEKVVAIITSANAVSAHLSEQIGTKIGVPVLTMSSDPTTTEIHLPWIFRMGPSDKQQARLIAQKLYQEDGMHQVLLVSEMGQDGCAGATAFRRAAHRLGAPPPISFVVNPSQPDPDHLLGLIRADFPQALVLWTGPHEASQVIPLVRRAGNGAVIYLCQAAAQAGSGVAFRPSDAAFQPARPGDQASVVVSRQWGNRPELPFARRYGAEMGRQPTPVAAETYDAVTLIAQALRRAGPNRARLRDQLAAVQGFHGASGLISFDNQGNNRATLKLIILRLFKRPETKADARPVSDFEAFSSKKELLGRTE